LAGELCTCGGDHAAAFARYQDRMMPFLKRKQKSAARFASSFAPKSAFGITVRDLVTRLLRIPFLADSLFASDLRDDIELPDYGFSGKGGRDREAIGIRAQPGAAAYRRGM
jgi:2-polyprenyl-6-methoxyphenol hydroxylase-like FAD-dependent oxidoreductase